MNTLSPDDIRDFLRRLRRIEALTTVIRHDLRPPTVEELFGAIGATDAIRDKLLAVCVCEVEVEQLAEAAD